MASLIIEGHDNFLAFVVNLAVAECPLRYSEYFHVENCGSARGKCAHGFWKLRRHRWDTVAVQ